MRAGTPAMLVSGVLLVLLGAFYVVEARRLRDWTVRTMQREPHLTWVRVIGAIMVLAGIGVLVALGLG